MSANQILPGLYVGSYPTSARSMADAGINTLVLCARELQKPTDAEQLPGFRVIRCPMGDDPTVPIPEDDWKRAVATARACASMLRAKQRVLITCAKGINRSAFVATLVVYLISGASGWQCEYFVRERRPGALQNPQFVRRLRALPARAPAVVK